MYKKVLKPALDIIISFIGMVIMSPIFIIVWVSLVLTNHGNAFFLQKRPGKGEKIFSIIKFRTMNNNKDKNGNLLPDSDRLTTVGKIVRKLSLDELPQLINVLKGDMSLIGPRPLLPEYLSLYNDYQKRRHLVKPGITGWAQVNGRNIIDWPEKFGYDVWYVDNVSFIVDLKIIVLTLSKVVKLEGINREGEATNTRFKGN